MNTRNQKLSEFKFALINPHDVPTPAVHKWAFCYLTSQAFLMLLLGILVMGCSFYIFGANNINITYGSELFWIMISGAALLLISIFLWISTCHYTNELAKIALTAFAIFSFGIFALSGATTIYSSIYFESELENNTEVYHLLNNTIYSTYKICCDKNSPAVLKQVCHDVMGHNNNTAITYECTFKRFELYFLTYVHSSLIWILTIGGITSMVNLISGITSCCLILAYKRMIYYKNG
jgi:hypothetical protein